MENPEVIKGIDPMFNFGSSISIYENEIVILPET